jgi:ribosome biogenesis SPOUT family RNA methylase Rps3
LYKTEVGYCYHYSHGRILNEVLICAVPVDKIPYLDHPELKINRHESTEMPFRYVKGEDGRPIMPKVRGIVYAALQ